MKAEIRSTKYEIRKNTNPRLLRSLRSLAMTGLFCVVGIMSSYAADVETVLEDSAGASGFNIKAADGTSRVLMKSNGNVGIGTTDPRTTLEVYSALNQQPLIVHPGVAGGVDFVIDQWGQVSAYGCFLGWDTNVNNTAYSKQNSDLYITSGWRSATKYNIYLMPSGSGNVGIGTTNPMAKLEVNGIANVNGSLWLTDTANASGVLWSAGGAIGHAVSNTNFSSDARAGDTVMRPGNGKNLLLAYGSDPNYPAGLLLDSSGKIGIGTTNPSSHVYIYTNAAVDSLAIRSTIGGVWTFDQWGQLTSDGGFQLGWDNNVSTASYSMAGDLYLTSGKSNPAAKNIYLLPSGSGKVGISTTNPSATLHINGAAGAVSLEVNSNETVAGNNVFMLRSDVAGPDDKIFRVQANGATFADGAYAGTGADYAEWFEKETEIKPHDLVGLSLVSGKVRKYQPGDVLVGVCSERPGFIGNQSPAKTDMEMQKEYALVALVGQVDVPRLQVNISGKKVYTLDNVFIGYVLSNGKVLLRIAEKR